MFRSAAEIDHAVTSGSLRTAVKDYLSTSTSWYDGTIQSVDRRMAKAQRMVATLQSASGRYRVAEQGDYLELNRYLHAQLEQLGDLHENFLGGHQVSAVHVTKDSSPLSREAARYVTLESQKFLAAQAGTYGSDVEELMTRAANHVAAETSTWDQRVARQVTAHFVDRVGELGRLASRDQGTANRRLMAYQDFDDSLTYLD